MKRFAVAFAIALSLALMPTVAYAVDPYCGHGVSRQGSYREVFVKHATLADGRHRHRYLKQRHLWGSVWYPYAYATRNC